MDVPVPWPLPPTLARLARELPQDGFLYEPKWDGFRCLAARQGADVDLRSRHGRPLARYFPELVEALLLLPRDAVLDGEIVVSSNDTHDFAALLARIHPAAARVERLRGETPASYVAFDLLAESGRQLLTRPFAERRRRLEQLLERPPARLRLTEITATADDAEHWLDLSSESGIDGVVAKAVSLPYEPGSRSMIKVKRERTADCVVAGFRWLGDRPLPSSLLLGLYDDSGGLQHVGVASSFTQAARAELLEFLRAHVVDLPGHPWEHGFLLGGSPTGRLRGAAGRWTPDMTRDWTPVAPELVCEVGYDQVDGDRFRHPARFRRWRLDREPRSCTFEQLVVARTAGKRVA